MRVPSPGGSTGEEEGEGGFAGAVAPDDDRVFGALEAERDAAQRGVVGTRVGEGGVGEGQGQGRGWGPLPGSCILLGLCGSGGSRVGAAGRFQKRVPPGVEGDAAQDRAEEPARGEDQEGNADESGDGQPHPPEVDQPLAQKMASVDEPTESGDAADECEEAVECFLDAFEAEVAQVDEEPEGDAGPDAPDDAEAGGDRTDAQPGGVFLVENTNDEADEGGLEGSAGGSESADGDGQEDGGGEGRDGGAGAQFEGDHGEGYGRGYLEEKLEDGRDGGDEAEGNGQARERACGRHLNRSEAACVTRVVTHVPSLPGPALICDRRAGITLRSTTDSPTDAYQVQDFNVINC